MSLIQAIQEKLQPGGPTGTADAADLRRINAYASVPLTAADVFVFACVVANHEYRKDQPWRFGVTSLQNFAADAASGIPYHIQHDRYLKYNGGNTYAGFYDAGAKEARGAVYLVRGFVIDPASGLSADQEIDAIQKGLRRMVSVGPAGMGRWMCDLCGEDVFGSICPHLPGRTYEGKLATATVEDLRAVEVSGVDVGAVPGALILKAVQQVSEHRLAASHYNDWCHRLGVPPAKLPLADELPPAHPKNDPPAPMPGKEGNAMREKLAAALTRLGLTTLAAHVLGAREDDVDDIAQRLSAQVQSEVQAQTAANPLLQALQAQSLQSPADIQAAAAALAASRQHVEAMRAEAEQWAVALYTDRPEQLQSYQAALRGGNEAAVRLLHEQLGGAYDAKFGTTPTAPAARQTVPTPLANVALRVPQQATDEDEEELTRLRAQVRKNHATPSGNGKGGNH